jgi:hypothetical protein
MSKMFREKINSSNLLEVRSFRIKVLISGDV